MNLEHGFFVFIALWLCGLTGLLWRHRAAIRGLIAVRKRVQTKIQTSARDIEAIEAHLTEPKR